MKLVDLLIFLFATPGIVFFLKYSELIEKPREFLFRKSPWFFKLFACPFCLGFHAGYLTYLLFLHFNINYFILSGFAGAMISYFVFAVLSKLNAIEN